MISITIYGGNGGSATVSLPNHLASALVAAGRAVPVIPADYAALLAGNQVFVPSATSFLPTVAAGALIASLNDPFVGLGIGPTTYATFGIVPSQLSLANGSIVAGVSAAIAGSSYSIGVEATSGDGQRKIGETLTFLAIRAASAGVPTLPSGFAFSFDLSGAFAFDDSGAYLVEAI